LPTTPRSLMILCQGLERSKHCEIFSTNAMDEAEANLQMLGSFPSGGIAVVFGSTGGIGRALEKQLRGSSAFAKVSGFSRSSTPAIDLTDENSISRAAKTASALGEIRLVIDATGFLHDEIQRPERSWREIESAKLSRAFTLNAIGPALIMKHFLPVLCP
jgi:NAD(P)-dependent dehydrogenase (short-subunit alcohol dehydrogenase family)